VRAVERQEWAMAPPSRAAGASASEGDAGRGAMWCGRGPVGRDGGRRGPRGDKGWFSTGH
jgi:hypothetical protein